MRTVALTGATGFVGQPLAAALSAAGFLVLPVPRAGWPGPEEAGRRWLDAGVDVLVHTAWAARPPDYVTTAANGRALAFTAELFEAAVLASVSHVVGFGTCIECGPVDGPRDEHLPPDPRSPYAAAKVAAHQFGTALFQCHDRTAFAWVRPFHLFGQGEDPRRLVPSVVGALRTGRPIDLSPGAQERDWIHVEDAAAAVVRIVERRASGPFHLCTGEAESLRQFLGRFATCAGRPELLRWGARPYAPGEEPVIAGATTRLQALGWAPLRDRAQRVTQVWEAA